MIEIEPAESNTNPASADADPVNSQISSARKRAALSLAINLALALAKGIAGVVGNSSALVGDAIHSTTDAVGSMAAFMGLWLAGKKHPAFPYGLYKAETLATLLIAGIIILAGYEIGRQAFLGPQRIPDIALTLPVAMVSLVVSIAFGIFQFSASRRLNSKALEADARDYLADGFSTAVVIFSLAGGLFGLQLDRWGAAIVSLFVLWSGGRLALHALSDLMDQAIDRDTERKIIRLVESHPQVARVERFLSRRAGGRYIIDLDVVFGSRSLPVVHRIGHDLEDEIRRRHQRVVMVGIRAHIDLR
jgi:cation diffusion facilitator family transporter